ncbi:MAG TPA: hypothetical protein PLD54_01195 [Candidatus Levybacteria bacterium]|nr:hypothetical protein [Candidatus Levybacteria bacterium]
MSEVEGAPESVLAEHTTDSGIPPVEEEDISESATSDNTTSQEDQKESVSLHEDPRKQTSQYFNASREYIQKHQQVLSQQSEEMSSLIDSALTYDGNALTRESSESLKSMLTVLSQTGNAIGQDLAENLSRYIKVKDENGKLHTPAEWKTYLESLSEDERSTAETEGLYAFRFPQTEDATQQEDEVQIPDITNRIITERISALKSKIEAGGLNGEDLEAHKQVLAKLESAERAKGEFGILLKARAIEEVEAYVPISDEEKQLIMSQYEDAHKKFEEAMREHDIAQEDVTSLLEKIQSGDLEEIQNHPAAQKIEGFAERIYGTEITADMVNMVIESSDIPEDVKERLKLNKDSLSFALLLALYGIVLAIGSVENIT